MDEAIQEAIRRRMGQQPSAAGMPGANVNPMARSAQAVQRPSETYRPTSAMMGAMKTAQPGEAMTILKAVLARLRNLQPGQ